MVDVKVMPIQRCVALPPPLLADKCGGGSAEECGRGASAPKGVEAKVARNGCCREQVLRAGEEGIVPKRLDRR